jgi:hypothetical protein
MNKPRRMLVDQACFDLVEHFLADVPGSTDDERREFAEDLQRVCEDHCCRIEIAHLPQLLITPDSQGG